jgi:microsomal dipeptidase-like Zn-dependent dipeptidase
LTNALLDGGFDDEEVEGILGGNALRVLERVEADARRDPS